MSNHRSATQASPAQFRPGTSIFSSCGRLPQLAQRPGFDLPNPLLGHAHSAPTSFKRLRLLAVIQAESADDDLLLALVKPLQNLADLRSRADSAHFPARTGRCGAPRSPPNISAWLVRKRSRCSSSSGIVRAKFFMIAQLAYVLNLLPRAKSNFSTARISDMLPSLTSSKKFSPCADVPLGDRNHQPQVGPDDLVLQSPRPRRTASRFRPSRCSWPAPDRARSRSLAALYFR